MACSSKLCLTLERPPANIYGIDASKLYKRRNVSTAVRKECDAVVVKNHREKLINRRANQALPHRGVGRKKKSLHIPVKEYDRVKSQAKVISLDERLDNLVKQEEEAKKNEREAEELRNKYKKIDDVRKKRIEANTEKEDLFGTAEKLKILDKAYLAKYEQEDEVKRVNRLILDAKCHAMRDAQVQEKIAIERYLKKETISLEKKVVEIAKKSLEDEDAKYEAAYKEKLKYAKEIKKQLNERDNMRFLEAERIESESKIIRKACEALKRDEERQIQLARERKLKFRNELQKLQEMNAIFKNALCEQNNADEKRAADYLQQKREREKFERNEKKLQKEEIERKRIQLFALAQKTLESINDRQEMTYVRDQERTEREWRKKERDAVLRKKQVEHELLSSRNSQLEEIKIRRASQICRDEKEFKILAANMKKNEENQRKMDIERLCVRNKYRDDIIRQMSENELERRRLVDLERNQAYEWRESEHQRDENIKAIIDVKLKAMREACLPEKYVKEIEHKLKNMKK